MAERADYSRLREGLCPVHGTALDRRDDNGSCDDCGHGWSLAGDELTMHMEFETSTLSSSVGKFTSGPGTFRFSRRIT